jgi:hypothetical protein
MDTQVVITLAIIIGAYFAIVNYKKSNSSSSSNSTSSKYKKNKEIPPLTDEKAIKLFDYLRIDYRRLSRNAIEFYNPVGPEYSIGLFQKGENETDDLGLESIVYQAKFIKPFLNIFESIKATDFLKYTSNFPIGNVFYLSKDIDKIETKDLISFDEKIISILGNPHDVFNEEIDLSTIKKNLKKDKSPLHLSWENAFNILDEDGDSSEHLVTFQFDFDNSRYILWIS